VMFIILSILVLIAAMNIISGLIMLVKNKGRDIGILRTMGLSEGSILRVFFLCGSLVGIVGTGIGVVAGCLFALYIDPIFSFVNYVSGGGVWDPSVRGIYALPAELRLEDVLKAVSLSLGLSFIVTIFPARRAARIGAKRRQVAPLQRDAAGAAADFPGQGGQQFLLPVARDAADAKDL
ncbi:MAG: FtsX-like permease family protein, partial [Pararhodobacter sp.]